MVACAFEAASPAACNLRYYTVGMAARIQQRSEETLPFADWLIQDGGFVKKFVILCRLIFIASPN